MTVRELLSAMNLPITQRSLRTRKAWLLQAYDYWKRQEDKDLATRFLKQFIKK